MAAPTARALLERLRAIYEEQEGVRLSDEKLAGRLPITLSTFNRWKKGDTPAFRNVVALLDQAGWISTGEDLPTSSAPATDLDALLLGISETLRILALNQNVIADHLDIPEAERVRLTRKPSPARRAPRRKAG